MNRCLSRGALHYYVTVVKHAYAMIYDYKLIINISGDNSSVNIPDGHGVANILLSIFRLTKTRKL